MSTIALNPRVTSNPDAVFASCATLPIHQTTLNAQEMAGIDGLWDWGDWEDISEVVTYVVIGATVGGAIGAAVGPGGAIAGAIAGGVAGAVVGVYSHVYDELLADD